MSSIQKLHQPRVPPLNSDLLAVGGADVAGQLKRGRREILARRQQDEHIMKEGNLAVGLAMVGEETGTSGALCVAMVRITLDNDLYFG